MYYTIRVTELEVFILFFIYILEYLFVFNIDTFFV